MNATTLVFLVEAGHSPGLRHDSSCRPAMSTFANGKGCPASSLRNSRQRLFWRTRPAGEDECQRVRGGVLKAVGMTFGDCGRADFPCHSQSAILLLIAPRARPTASAATPKWSESFRPSWMLLIASTESDRPILTQAQCDRCSSVPGRQDPPSRSAASAQRPLGAPIEAPEVPGFPYR